MQLGKEDVNVERHSMVSGDTMSLQKDFTLQLEAAALFHVRHMNVIRLVCRNWPRMKNTTSGKTSSTAIPERMML